MARRKANKGFLSDGDSTDDSGGDGDDFDSSFLPGGDDAEERALFEDPYSKKRKRGGKEDALYGVFADDDDEDEGVEGFGKGKGKARGGGGPGGKRMDWTKAPSFKPSAASSSASTSQHLHNLSEMDVDSIPELPQASKANELESDEGSSFDDSHEEEDEDRQRAPARERDEEESEEEGMAPPMRGFGSGGIGSSTRAAATTLTPSAPEASFSHPIGGGIGPSSSSAPRTSGIGFKPSGPSSSISNSIPPPASLSSSSSVPTAFGAKPKPPPTSRFARPRSPPRASSPSTVNLSAADKQAFRKMEGSFGARMLAKQGWQAGSGLGATGEGMVTPIQVVQRGQGMGLGAGGFKERSEASRKEAIRKGEIKVDEDEGGKGKKGKKSGGLRKGTFGEEGGEKKEKQESWRKSKKVNLKPVHKTYEELVAEAGEMGHAGGVGMIIDATGATPVEVSSISALSLSTGVPSAETTKLPELRYNLRYICDSTKVALDALAREGLSVAEKKRWLVKEDENLRHRVSEEAKKIARFQQIRTLVDEIGAISKTLSSAYEVSLEPFTEPFEKLLYEFKEEYVTMDLDEVVVGAMAPVVRRLVSSWNPLSSSTELFASLEQWKRKKAFRFVEPKKEDDSLQLYGGSNRSRAALKAEQLMTPYESMMWNVWLPKVRSAINNDWSPSTPSPAVALLETWQNLLPAFLYDNILDQLILPKLNKAIAEWKPPSRSSSAMDSTEKPASLQGMVFPWLPFLGERMEEVLGEAKRKIRGMMKGWKVQDKVPDELRKWKDIFTSLEWDSLILKSVLPKLGSLLRDAFEVRPSAQDMTALEYVLPWGGADGVIKPTMFSQLLETEFFPKWLDVLFRWLTASKPNFDEVTQWYSYWKTVFGESISSLPGVSQGFKRGLDLMNQAMALGPLAPTKLSRPDTTPLSSSRFSSSRNGSSIKSSKSKPSSAPSSRSTAPLASEITFRSIAEDYIAQQDLIWVPTGRSDVNTGNLLFRVSKDGRNSGGVVCYVSEDAVYVPAGGEGAGEKPFVAVTLEELVRRAKK